VSPFVGELPPELRERVPARLIARRTAQFHDALVAFVVEKYQKISISCRDHRVPFPAATKLFGTRCVVEYDGLVFSNGRFRGKWRGMAGIVCRISFPKIGAAYALKIFRTLPDSEYKHSLLWDIPTAFNANHAEPRNNSRVYMAALVGRGYMLSKWVDCPPVQNGRKFCRHNENKIFYTVADEYHFNNYLNGLRIDYGKTYQTAYGALSYPLRKLYRKIKNAAMRGAVDEINEMIDSAKGDARRDMNRVMKTLSADAYRDGKKQIRKIINQASRRIR